MAGQDLSPKDELILVGRIGAPHSIKGAVRIRSFTQNPLALADYGALYDNKGNKYIIKNIRQQKNIVTVQFEHITNRNEAEKLNGTELFIDRKALPNNLSEDEFYVHDLIGCDVLDENSKLIGTIIYIDNFGAGDLLEIAPINEDGKFSNETYYLVFNKENVPEVNIEQNYILINPPTETMGAENGKEK